MRDRTIFLSKCEIETRHDAFQTRFYKVQSNPSAVKLNRIVQIVTWLFSGLSGALCSSPGGRRKADGGG